MSDKVFELDIESYVNQTFSHIFDMSFGRLLAISCVFHQTI